MDDLLDKKEYPDASIDREYDYNLLLHVDSEDPKILDMALANAHNFIEALPDITIRVVMVITGPTVKLLTEPNSDLARKMGKLLQKGMGVLICRNALKGYQVDESSLWPNLEVVDDGIVEIVRLQDEGMAYVKP